jgi:chemotaxis protein CheZ
MAARRKIFRIERSGAARSDPPTRESNESESGDGDILRELGALRALLAPAFAAPQADGRLARENDIRRLASELRLILSAIRGPRDGQAMAGGPCAPTVRIAAELEAVVADSEIAAQKILAAAESVDQAANNLAGLLKGHFERSLAQDIRDRVVQIFEACNFQDLTSQRVAKVRASFISLDHQITRALEALARADTAPPLHGPRLGYDTGHVSQKDIDSLFEGDVSSGR